jgi:hypothetical protein
MHSGLCIDLILENIFPYVSVAVTVCQIVIKQIKTGRKQKHIYNFLITFACDDLLCSGTPVLYKIGAGKEKNLFIGTIKNNIRGKNYQNH